MFLIFDSPYTIFLPPYTLSHIYRSGILVEYIDRQKRLHWRLFQAHFILFRIVSSFKFTFYLALSTINKVSLFPIFLGRVSIFFVETFINLEKYFLFWITTYPTTAGPRLTRILGPEKNSVRRNRTVWGLWDYTMQRHRKIALERGIALITV